MKFTGRTNFTMKLSQCNRQSVVIGGGIISNLPFLVPQNKRQQVKVLTIGNAIGGPNCVGKKEIKDHQENEDSISPIEAVDYFVASSNGDIEEILLCVEKLKEINPCLKVILADSLETPSFREAPPGVDLVIPVTRDQCQAATGLLVKNEGLLTGPSGGQALCSSALLANNIKEPSTILTAITNLNLELMSQLNI